MQENKFENRVQRQMDELRIRPSETVWEKVEEELRKKKKRRIVFYLFLLAGIGLIGYSGIFIYHNSKPNLVQQTITVSKENHKPEKNNEQFPSIESSTSHSQPSKKENQMSSQEKTNSTVTRGIVLNDKKITTNENLVGKKQGGTALKKSTNKTPPVETINRGNTVVKSKYLKTKEKSNVVNAVTETNVISKADISQPVVAEIELMKDIRFPSLNESIHINKDSLSITMGIKKEEIPAAKIKLKQVPKINWGIDLSVGISSYKDNFFSIYDGQKSLYMDYNSSPNNASGGPQAISYSPSSIQSGPAFRLGVVAELKLSKKSSISSGILYAYYSNRIQVGVYRDTSVLLSSSFSLADRINAVYTGAQQKEYTNRFHFIQLPVQYQLQLNKGLKLPISWSIGTSIGYLFATNGLVYDTAAGGIYYPGKDAFNKVQVNINTGFSFRFGNKSKVQWSVGPELSLGLNKLIKNDFTEKQYLLYSGITGRIIFGKKK